MPAMRFFIICLSLWFGVIAACDTVVSVAFAVDTGPAGKSSSLDELFGALKRERNTDKANEISSRIQAELGDSHSATVNLLMKWSADAIAAKKNSAALDFLDQVTLLKPDFAEGWNRRATLYYTMEQPRKAMADLDRVLSIEPRHLGALAGMAGILAETGRDEAALRIFERYLALYPSDRDVQQAAAKLAEKIAGSRT